MTARWLDVGRILIPLERWPIERHCGDRGPRDGLYRCTPLFIRAWFCLTTPVTSNLY